MNKFESMSTQTLLEIINFKYENTLSHDELQGARAEFLSRISKMKQIRIQEQISKT